MATLYEKLGKILGISCFVVLVGGFAILASFLILVTYNFFYAMLFLLSLIGLIIIIYSFIHSLNLQSVGRTFVIPIITLLGLVFGINLYTKNLFNSFCYTITFTLGFIILIILIAFFKHRCIKNSVETKEYTSALESFDFVKALEIMEKAFINPKNKFAKFYIAKNIFQLSDYIKQYDKIIKYEQLMQKDKHLSNNIKINLLLNTYCANICLKKFFSLPIQKIIIYKLMPSDFPKERMNLIFTLYEVYIMIEQNQLQKALYDLEQNFEKYKKIACTSELYNIYYEIYHRMNDINNAKKYIQLSIANFDTTTQSYTRKMILIDKLSKLN